MSRKSGFLTFSVTWILLVVSTSAGRANEQVNSLLREAIRPVESFDIGPTPMESSPQGYTGIFHVPAPRGLILTRDGQPIAYTYTGQRLTVQLQGLADSESEALTILQQIGTEFGDFEKLAIPDEDKVRAHFENRRWIPIPISGELTPEEIEIVETRKLPGVKLETVYLRRYPHGALFGHLSGYTGESMPDQHGPIGETEYLWPTEFGRSGLEKTLDQELSGEPGQISRLFDSGGRLTNQEIVQAPSAGQTVVTSLSYRMQKLAAEELEKTGRSGAFVAVDADTGEVLAMVSNPSYDPNEFLGGISQARFAEIRDDPEAPLYDRAATGIYPPGSTFKPFVALAGMEAGTVDGSETRYEGFAVMDIRGKEFKNWYRKDEPFMDVRYALLRSNNSWFYQAGMEMGSYAMIDGVLRFGFGSAPPIPLPAVSKGNIPSGSVIRDDRAIANVSIGQGEVLVSPLQLALAMSGLSNGEFIPEAKLILRTENPLNDEILREEEARAWKRLYIEPTDLDLIHAGMWGVVNYSGGTARRVAMTSPVVYGKTGTSQWADSGQELNLAWFAGWVDTQNPRIAFAALSLGRPGESLSGGSSAGPIVAGFLKNIYKSPELYAVAKPDKPLRDNPDMKEMLGQRGEGSLVMEQREEIPVRAVVAPRRTSVGGAVKTFFRKLFGGR